MSMLEQRAEVIGIQGHYLHLRPLLRPDCPRCASGNGCGAQLFRSTTDSKAILKVMQSENLAVSCGDVVVVGMAPQLLQRAALWLYGVPLLAMLAAVSLAAAWSFSEGTQVLLMTLVLVFSFWLVRQRMSALTRQPLLTVLRVVTSESSCPVSVHEVSASPRSGV